MEVKSTFNHEAREEHEVIIKSIRTFVAIVIFVVSKSLFKCCNHTEQRG